MRNRQWFCVPLKEKRYISIKRVCKHRATNCCEVVGESEAVPTCLLSRWITIKPSVGVHLELSCVAHHSGHHTQLPPLSSITCLCKLLQLRPQLNRVNKVSHSPTLWLYKSICSWCDGSSDRSFIVDPLSYFLFQPVLHDWCNQGHGMCYPVCGMVHIKEPLLLIGKSSPCGGSRFPPSWTHWAISCSSQCYMIGVTKAMVCAILSMGWCI